ncbi:MAG: hypothetical protein ACR2J9_09595 [Gaiellales bacterium]
MTRCGFAITLALAALAVVAPVAVAGTPTQDLAWLNALRATNDIPGDIVMHPDWAANCAQHVSYMRVTGTVTHPEDPSSAAWSEGGNWAGTHAVLASTIPWTESAFIWESAPLHLAQLLAPQLSQTGIADDGQLVCVTTWPGYLRAAPATDAVLTYPGNGSTIYSREVSEEWPITPASALGLANPTGPHLYVYAWGPASDAGITADGQPLGIRSASLRGPSGPVALHWVDNVTPQIGQYLPTASGILIPDHPLAEQASYLASVTFTNGVTHTWGFTTLAAPPAYVVRGVRLHARRTVGTRLRLTIRGRLADHASGVGLGGVVVSLSSSGRTKNVTTRPGGRFTGTLVVSRGTRIGTLVVTLRAADSFTAAYDAPFNR